MENATKALLIAGSILIAILLIAMGLRIFNSTSETTEQSQRAMDTTAVATFNNQFIPYLGENKSRAQAISLVNTVIANNVNSSNKAVNVVIEDNFDSQNSRGPDGSVPELNIMVNDKIKGNSYKITIHSRDNEGRIECIVIHRTS